MKRSTIILLGATGVLIAGAWFGRSTGPLGTEEKAELYDDMNACVSANVLTRDECEAQFASARERHLAEAPRFADNGACEAQYGAGQCQPATIAGTNYFLPIMAGILAGRMLGNRRPVQALLPPLRSAQPCAPGFTPLTQPGCVVQRATAGSGTPTGSWRSYTTTRGTTISKSTASSSTVILPRGTVTPRSTSSRSSTTSSSSGVSRGGFGSTARSTSASSSS